VDGLPDGNGNKEAREDEVFWFVEEEGLTAGGIASSFVEMLYWIDNECLKN
jgi:hypothetical protein